MSAFHPKPKSELAHDRDVIIELDLD